MLAHPDAFCRVQSVGRTVIIATIGIEYVKDRRERNHYFWVIGRE